MSHYTSPNVKIVEGNYIRSEFFTQLQGGYIDHNWTCISQVLSTESVST